MNEQINTNPVAEAQEIPTQGENSLFTNPNLISELNGEKQEMTEMEAVFAGVTLHSESEKAEDVEENTDSTVTEEDDIAATPSDAEDSETADNKGNKADDRDPAKRFIELAENRTNKIIDEIDKLGKLAARKNYIYTQEQVEKMFSVLEDELAFIKKKFSEDKEEAKTKRFSF